jgi:hypothetical protein
MNLSDLVKQWIGAHGAHQRGSLAFVQENESIVVRNDETSMIFAYNDPISIKLNFPVACASLFISWPIRLRIFCASFPRSISY